MARTSSLHRGPTCLHSEYKPPLVISVHGIRTDGGWQKVFASVMSEFGIRNDSLDYGRYGLLRFLVPPFNDRLVDRFYDWYHQTVKSCREANLEKYDSRPSAVAHSLGSWIIGNAMLKFSDIRFDKLVLTGCILPRSFDWGTLFARDQIAAVRNECGQRDPWPRWAGLLVARTGTAGTEGFDWFHTAVENIRCEWFGHSDSLMRPHIEHEWVSFLRRPPSPLSLLHGQDIHEQDRFIEISNYTGPIIDKNAFGEAAVIPRGLALTWVRVNPDIYTFLIHRESRKPAGYLNAMPVVQSRYDLIRAGENKDKDITAEEVVPFVGAEKTMRVYLMSIAIAEEHRRWGDGIFQQGYIQLLSAFLDKLKRYAQSHGVCVTHFIAVAWTAEGCRICEFFGMREVKRDRENHRVFELDLSEFERHSERKPIPALKKLLDVYKAIKS